MITLDDFNFVLFALGPQGENDIIWAEGLKAPDNADNFALETIFVICNSGMQNKIARQIYDKVADNLQRGGKTIEVFKHKGKAAAIDRVWADREALLAKYLEAPDKIAFCQTIPWIGSITCYHMAKNFGADVAKPDVHLQRLADREGVTPQQLCERLAAKTGYRVATVDTILWRACANGIIKSNTGQIKVPT